MQRTEINKAGKHRIQRSEAQSGSIRNCTDQSKPGKLPTSKSLKFLHIIVIEASESGPAHFQCFGFSAEVASPSVRVAVCVFLLVRI